MVQQGNTQQLHLTLANTAMIDWQLARVSIINWAINTSYRIELQLRSKLQLMEASLLNKKAQIFIKDTGQHAVLSGVVIEVALQRMTQDALHYQLILGSPLDRLKYTSHDRVFVKQKLADIIANLTTDLTSFTLCYHEGTAEHICDFVTQYQQTDYEFLLSLLSELELSFVLRQEEDVVVCHILSTLGEISSDPIELPLVDKTQLVVPGSCLWSLQYHYQHQQPQHPSGVTVMTNQLSLQLGDRLIIQRDIYQLSELNALVTQGVGSAFSPTIDRQACHYTLRLVSESVAPVKNMPVATPLPTISLASTEALDHLQPYRDTTGYYYLRFNFDKQQRQPGTASIPIPLIQYYGDSQAPSACWDFPLYGGTPVAVIKTTGKNNRYVIIGVVATAQFSSIVNSDNQTQAMIRTAAGSELCFDDQPGKEMISVNLESRQAYLDLIEDSQFPHIALGVNQGDMRLQAARHMIMTSGEHRTKVQGSLLIEAESDHHLTSQQGKVLYQAAGQLMLHCDQDIRWQTTEDCHFQARQGDLICQAQQVNFQCQHDGLYQAAGAIDFYASKQFHVEDHQGEVIFANKMARFYCTSSGKLIFAGRKMTVNVDRINISQIATIN